MPGTTSTALPYFSHDQRHETDAAERKGAPPMLTRTSIWNTASTCAYNIVGCGFCQKQTWVTSKLQWSPTEYAEILTHHYGVKRLYACRFSVWPKADVVNLTHSFVMIVSIRKAITYGYVHNTDFISKEIEIGYSITIYSIDNTYPYHGIFTIM